MGNWRVSAGVRSASALTPATLPRVPKAVQSTVGSSQLRQRSCERESPRITA